LFVIPEGNLRLLLPLLVILSAAKDPLHLYHHKSVISTEGAPFAPQRRDPCIFRRMFSPRQRDQKAKAALAAGL
jgi:hypothetical protein